MYIEKVVYCNDIIGTEEYKKLKYELGMIHRDDLMNINTVTLDDVKETFNCIKRGEVDNYTVQQVRELFYTCFGRDVYQALMRGRIDRIYIFNF